MELSPVNSAATTGVLINPYCFLFLSYTDDMYSNEHKDKRIHRKLNGEKRRSNLMSTTSIGINQQHSPPSGMSSYSYDTSFYSNLMSTTSIGIPQQHLPPSTNSTYIHIDNENVNPNISSGYQQTTFQSTSTFNIKNPLTVVAKENRKLRKLYLDNKRSNHLSTTPSVISNITTNFQTPSSNKFTYHYGNNQNVTPASSYGYQQTHVQSTSNIYIGSPLSYNAKDKRKERKIYLDKRKSNHMSTIPIGNNGRHQGRFEDASNFTTRTPMSNITNVNGECSVLCRDMRPTTSSSITRDYSNNLLCKNINKKRKFLNTASIPIFDLTSEQELHHQQIHKQLTLTSGATKDYLDHGDQSFVCTMCHAQLWRDEALKGNTSGKKTSFSLCCGNGKVELPQLKEPPKNYENLFRDVDPKGKTFMKNIRQFNSMFSFTSIGGKVDSSINKGNAPYVFRLSGQNYHCMGSLLPIDGSKPKFSQLYIYDTENEVSNRQQAFSTQKEGCTSTSHSVDIEIIRFLKDMLDSTNELVKCYRMVRDCFDENPHIDVKLRLIGRRQQDGRTYNLPSASEVAALIVGDIGDAIDNRDIIVTTKSGSLQRINELHPSYLALQYPLLFPYGDDGYRVDIPHRDSDDPTNRKHRNCTMREFFAYRIQDRVNVFSLILNSRRLFQQFLVDAYMMIETERLYYIRNQQKVLRCESYETLRNIQSDGRTDISNIGKRVILPSSFTGGARYMMQNYLDAMSLCKWFGYPDFFITVTCNPKWPEIKRFLADTTLNPEDRPDILSRLFKIKLNSLIKDLKKKSLLGRVQAVVYTVEFQKRGLPHAHICLFMHSDYKLPTVEHVDRVISAEIPNKENDPELYALVSEFMMHGPCGSDNPKCPCMSDNKCSKNFPKSFLENTSVDSNGYPIYRRRNDGSFVEKSGVRLDNRSVVPYHKALLKRYQAHINVEWCNQAASIKYLFKYINKGPDRATVAVVQNNGDNSDDVSVDEIQNYYDCRYLSACEASWRIFAFDVHYRYPSVVRLPFHLPGKQNVVYGADDDIENVLNKQSVSSSMFLSWMTCNEHNADARKLSYVAFPTKFVWKQEDRCWEPRKKGFSIGRIHTVSPNLGEAYFLRILLNKVKGPKSFEDIRKVNGQVCPTFRDACYALGLLEDDKEYIDAIEEASHSGSGYYLRFLFATMLKSNSLSRPYYVWENTWQYLSDGILYNQRIRLKTPGLSLNDDQIKNLTLYEIEKILLQNSSSLRDFVGMPYPDHDLVSSTNNRLITEELDFDITILQKESHQLLESLTVEQRSIFDEIMTTIKENKGGVFFVYGYGGTGKTFLWKTLSASLRSKGDIVLNVASSGIASLLLTGGRTAHSRFIIPLNLTEDSFCSFGKDSDVAELLKKTSLIIWDEAPMIHKHAFEALDRSMKDIFTCDLRTNSKLPFGGKTIVFGGDFRQILPVIPNGSRQEIVGGLNDGETIIDIPDDLLIVDSTDPIGSLIEFVYPSIVENAKNPIYFQERAILAPKNEVVQEINERLLKLFPGAQQEYLSSDSLSHADFVHDNIDETLYSPDVLNGLKPSGMPIHKLVLKVGVPVMLLRNIDQKSGLCNGTRLRVLALGKRVIEAEIISGSNIGNRTFIPRMSLTPSDKRIPFIFQRRQFPLAVCFAMTINKSQ
uniref:ATP-dependent DNA helicase n=1 Tax=Lactuca sativa TaxID=4236 RepID=A0A9R1X0R5_LACSA|nr:hypothetical protein LSAT_V11C800414390 [Lactuca sativa]